jgi:hypothetical protein
VSELIEFIQTVANPLSYALQPSKYNAIFNTIDAYEDVFDTPDNIESEDGMGYTPITYCYVPRITDKLLRQGVDTQRKNGNDDPVMYGLLHMAMCTENEIACFRLLMNHTYKASNHPRIQDKNERGRSLIHMIYHKEVYDIFVNSTFGCAI